MHLLLILVHEILFSVNVMHKINKNMEGNRRNEFINYVPFIIKAIMVIIIVNLTFYEGSTRLN